MSAEKKIEMEIVDRSHLPHVRTRLSHEQKTRIVSLFAQFQGVASIRDAMKREFGLELAENTIRHYDPSKPGSRLSPRLKAFYLSAREAWVGQSAAIGVSYQNQRLRLIERAIDGAEKAKDFGNVARLLELAAKEMGGVLTNVSKVEHRGNVGHVHMSIEDARSELAARLAGVLDGGVLEQPKLLETNDKPSDLT
jgi:hypothetical protein